MSRKIFFITILTFLLNIPATTFAAVPANFTISAWIPYWAKTAGTKSAMDHLKYFNELHPFAYEVQPDGTIIDKMKLDQTPYKELVQKAKDNNPKILELRRIQRMVEQDSPKKSVEQTGDEQMSGFGNEDIDRLKKTIYKEEEKKVKSGTPTIYDLMKKKEDRERDRLE